MPKIVLPPNQEALTVVEAQISNVIANHRVTVEIYKDQGKNLKSVI